MKGLHFVDRIHSVRLHGQAHTHAETDDTGERVLFLRNSRLQIGNNHLNKAILGQLVDYSNFVDNYLITAFRGQSVKYGNLRTSILIEQFWDN